MNFSSVFCISNISRYSLYQSVSKRKNVLWHVRKAYVKHGHYWEFGKRIKTRYKIFLQAGRKMYRQGTQRYNFLRYNFFLRRRRRFKGRRRSRRFYSLLSLQYKKYVPLGAFKKKFYKFPFVCYVVKFFFR